MFVTIHESVLMCYFSLKSTTFSNFLSFPLLPLFWIQSRSQMAFSHCVPLGSPWLWQFLRLFFFMTLTVLRETSQLFCKMSLNWGLSEVSLMIKLGLYFANKGPSSQSCGFCSGHVWMWELDYKESWAPKNWCFWMWCWRRLLRVPWTARRSNQSILKEISPGCSLEGLML